jgi:tetratricopeptide (TPR) repeat protein
METRGDYPAALQLFEQIAKGNDRNLAARSLLYAGICYEKIGSQGARSAYERLIRDFADQAGPVAAARARLAAVTARPQTRPSSLTVAVTQLADFGVARTAAQAGEELTPFLRAQLS